MAVIGFLRSDAGDAESRVIGVPPGLERNRLCRGAERRDRISLGQKSMHRLPALAAELVRRPVSVIVGNITRGNRGQGRDHDHPDRLRVGFDPVELASSPASTGRAAMSPAWSFSAPTWERSALSSCASSPPGDDACHARDPNTPIPRRSEKRYRPRRKRSGSHSSLSMSRTSAKSQRICDVRPEPRRRAARR